MNQSIWGNNNTQQNNNSFKISLEDALKKMESLDGLRLRIESLDEINQYLNSFKDYIPLLQTSTQNYNEKTKKLSLIIRNPNNKNKVIVSEFIIKNSQNVMELINKLDTLKDINYPNLDLIITFTKQKLLFYI